MNRREHRNWKKTGVLLAAAICAAGCGANGESAEPAETVSEQNADVTVQTEEESAADLRTVYQSIEAAVELPSMVEGDDDYISNYYGIDPSGLEEYIFAEAEDATLASCVIMMKAKDEDAAGAVETALNTVLSQKAAEMQDYIPEQYDIVVDSSVKTKGLYVYLVISEDMGEIESVIQSALK